MERPPHLGSTERIEGVLGVRCNVHPLWVNVEETASGAPETMEVKVWGMESLRALFGRFDLTEEQFLTALDSAELGDMVGSIADD